MDNLQVLNDSLSRTPDLGWHLPTPVGVPGDALAITRQVQRRAVLPAGPKDSGHSPPLTTRPFIEGQHRVPAQVPRTAGRLRLWVAATVQAQNVFLVILGGNGYEGVRTSRSRPVASDPRSRRDGTQPWPRPVSKARWSGPFKRAPTAHPARVRPERDRRPPHAPCRRSAPLRAFPDWGAHASPRSAARAPPASSADMPNSFWAAHRLTRVTVALGLKWRSTVFPLNVTVTFTWRRW